MKVAFVLCDNNQLRDKGENNYHKSLAHCFVHAKHNLVAGARQRNRLARRYSGDGELANTRSYPLAPLPGPTTVAQSLDAILRFAYDRCLYRQRFPPI